MAYQPRGLQVQCPGKGGETAQRASCKASRHGHATACGHVRVGVCWHSSRRQSADTAAARMCWQHQPRGRSPQMRTQSVALATGH
eukprot:12590220-Alexandrium_andersonii.AAC.1